MNTNITTDANYMSDFFQELDDFEDTGESSESVEDLEKLSQELLSRVVLHATDWTTETVISQINKGNIQLNPDFQRREAWRDNRKSKFIESLILNFPVPQIVLAEDKARKGAYIVIDGKQRLLSIRQFWSDAGSAFKPLSLKGLGILDGFNGKSFEDIKLEPEHSDSVRAFENATIRTVVIKNWPNEDFLYNVFLRLNTGSVPLSPQELRQALHPGPFVFFVDTASGDSPALQSLLKRKTPDFRMRDAELLVRYYAFVNFLDQYSGNLKTFLDNTCMTLNQKWEQKESLIREQLESFEEAYNIVVQIFGDDAFKKYTGKKYERKYNRAIYDIMMYYFSTSENRIMTENQQMELKSRFEKLCAENPAFLASLERTTKSIDSTYTRLQLWGEVLREVIHPSVSVPRLVGNRIIG